MAWNEFEWDPRPPNTRERIIAGIWLIAFLMAVASSFAEWQLFGEHDRKVAGLLGIVGLVLFGRVLPSVRRL